MKLLIDNLMAGAGEESQACWFAAKTHSGQELKVRDILSREGVGFFIPTQRSSSGREIPLISALVFLRTTKPRALALTNEKGLPVRFLIDCATRTLAVVGDKEMEDFQRILDLSVEVSTEPFAPGDRIQGVKGPLKGVEGRVLELSGKYYIAASLLGSLYTKVRIPKSWTRRMEEINR